MEGTSSRVEGTSTSPRDRVPMLAAVVVACAFSPVLQRPLHNQRSARPCMAVVDLFPDPVPVTVGGIEVKAAPSTFPSTLEQPASFKAATLTPFPDMMATVLSPLEGGDLVAAGFLGVALMLGPDFLLAPAGLVSDEGVRPGYALESVIGDVVTPDAQWLKDRKEKLAADAPPQVRGLVLLPFLAAGLLANRLLLVALESGSFVLSVGIISCFGALVLEVIREPLPTRDERDLAEKLSAEFMLFSTERLSVGGRCHERDIVRAFRAFYPRYRSRDMRRSQDGVSVPDDEIADLVRGWNARMGRPAMRTPSGFWKGISVAPPPTTPPPS